MYSIIIPAFNELNRLPRTLQTLHEGLLTHGTQYEIIVIDDGSSDGTASLVKNDRLIQLPHNQGKGAAIKEGLKQAKGDTIIILDADLPTAVENIVALADLTQTCDIAIGSRRMPNSRVMRSKGREYTSNAFGVLARLITGLQYQDTQCGVKAMSKSAVESVLPFISEKGYLFDIDLLYAAKHSRLTVKEEGILWMDRKGSKVNVWRDSVKMAIGLFKLKYKYTEINNPSYTTVSLPQHEGV